MNWQSRGRAEMRLSFSHLRALPQKERGGEMKQNFSDQWEKLV